MSKNMDNTLIFIDTETITEEELKEGDSYESDNAGVPEKDC